VTQSGEPLLGARVWIKESSIGTSTDINGNYTINTGDVLNPILSVAYVGYKNAEEFIGTQSKIDFVLEESTEQMEEIVVVGYGVQRKESVIGAISSVQRESLQLPSGQLSTNLAGQVAGVMSIQRSGEPGEHSDFWIRGISTLGDESRKPLVLVDGIEREIDLVDVEDIQSFSVLKDATATAIYGVRGANGVLLITTRSGQEGAPKVSVRGESGIVSPTNMPKFVDAVQLASLYNEAYSYEHPGSTYYSPEIMEKYRTGSDPDLYPNVDWINELFSKFSTNQRVNVNVSGGGKVARYYISGTYYNEGSIYKEDNLKQYHTSTNYNKFNFRANIDVNIFASTVLNVNLSNIYEVKTAPNASSDDIWKSAYTVSPHIVPMRYSNGYLSVTQGSSTGTNPYNLITQEGYQNVYANNSQALIGLTQDFSELFLKGLKFNIKFSWDAVTGQRQRYQASPQMWIANGRDEDTGEIIYEVVREGSANMSYSKESSANKIFYLESSLTYDRIFNDCHRVGALFLFNQKSRGDIQATDIEKSRLYRHQGIAGRFTYSFDDRYFVEGNFGYNGSENFSPGKRLGFFPSGALGWMISNEKFFSPLVRTIDLLKIRGSYGVVGNDKISVASGAIRRFIYNGTFEDVASAYGFGATGGYSQGYRFGEFANPNVSWEKSYKADLGLEISFLKSLKFQIDYFHENRKNIFILNDNISSIIGVTTKPYVNKGETKNKGWDIQAEGYRTIGKVNLSVRGNFTYNHNVVIENGRPPELFPYLEKRGHVIDQQFGLQALGLYQSEDEIPQNLKLLGVRVGDIRYVDQNNDGQIDETDYVAIGHSWLPEITYGFGSSLQWNNFDFSFLFQGVGKVTMMLNGAAVWPFYNNDIKIASFYEEVYNNIWRLDNPSSEATFPRASITRNNYNTQYYSTFWQRDVSYMRLKNVTIGYTVPISVTQRLKMSQIRFYLTGMNLLTFSKFKMFDPEIGNGLKANNARGQGDVYPPSRIISLGLNFSF
jgi:TonB-linked SusC/RagA family outer membrane protein